MMIAVFMGTDLLVLGSPIRLTSSLRDKTIPVARTVLPSSRAPGTQLAHEGRVAADLVAELLVHADDDRVSRLDALVGRLEARPHLGRGLHAPPRGEDLVRQAGLLRRLDHLE